jgi:hypothetical protein
MVTRLVGILQEIVNDPQYAPKPDGTTFCNYAVADTGTKLGIHTFSRSQTANDMYAYAKSTLRKLTGEQAAELAKEGRWVVAAQNAVGHGHINSVYPADMQHSNSWGHDVPMAANVGHKNGIMKESQSFHTEPEYYLVS